MRMALIYTQVHTYAGTHAQTDTETHRYMRNPLTRIKPRHPTLPPPTINTRDEHEIREKHRFESCIKRSLGFCCAERSNHKTPTYLFHSWLFSLKMKLSTIPPTNHWLSNSQQLPMDPTKLRKTHACSVSVRKVGLVRLLINSFAEPSL